MLFLLPLDEPILHVMLVKDDLKVMELGRTLFVDDRQLSGRTFKSVVLSLHEDKAAALKILEQAGYSVSSGDLVSPSADPTKGEDTCVACGGIMPAASLNAGKCIVCWRALAIELMGKLSTQS